MGCLFGKHVWVQYIDGKGHARLVCAICNRPK